jgi:hypothetical protein
MRFFLAGLLTATAVSASRIPVPPAVHAVAVFSGPAGVRQVAEIEYRFAGRHLILLDTHARIVIDVLLNVLAR